jgi:hypothetical protein
MEDRKNIRDAIAEAESTPLGFLPKERAAFVRSMIATITSLRDQGKPVDEIQEQFPEFARDYKNLFETITSPSGYDKQNLKVMLAMLDRMGDGQLTQHQASVIIGKKLADQYITPTIGPGTSSSKPQ